MKYFWLFFSVFILYLSISPCCDEEACTETPETHIAAISKDHSHEEDSHHTEVCSPFCLCSCCGNHVVNQTIFPVEVPENILESTEYKVSLYTSQFTSNFEVNIWQPPQLG